MLLLAQSRLPDPNSAVSVGWVLLVLVVLLGLALTIKQLFQRTPPLHEEFVTRKEFDRHVADVSSQLERIEEKGEARVIRIYDKIDETSERQTARLIEAIQNASRK